MTIGKTSSSTNSAGSTQKVDDEIAIPAAITEDVFHYAVHEGVSFSASDYALTPSVNTGAYITFTTPNTDTLLHIIPEISGEDSCELHVYEGATAGVGGSDKAVFNKNRAAGFGGGTTASAVSAGNTGTAGSVQIGIASTGGTLIYDEFQSKNSGGRDATYELVLEKNTTYSFHALARIANKNTGINLVWFEVPNA